MLHIISAKAKAKEKKHDFCPKKVGEKLGIDWENSSFSVEEFGKGIEVEFEHGAHDPDTDVTGDDLEKTAKIAWAHLKEIPDYYVRLLKMEEEAGID